MVFQIPERLVLSDDTQFTLATCESIIECGGVQPEHLAMHFLRWFQAKRVNGIGSSTLKAMRDLAGGTHWALAGARGEFAAGNGAAMRIAPLAFLLDPTDTQNRTAIRDVCRITHANDEAYIGALAVMLSIRAVLLGAWSPHHTFLSLTRDELPDSAVRDRIQELARLNLPVSQVAQRFGTSGHVVDTVPLALYCAQSIASEPITDVLAQTVSLGGDTDTITAIVGQIAGTVVGSKGVPHDLVMAIDGSDELIAIAGEFAEFIASQDEYETFR